MQGHAAFRAAGAPAMHGMEDLTASRVCTYLPHF